MSGTARVVGVRHHSPAAARAVRELLVRERPTTVLVEGPEDFTPRVAELALDHELPIALYASVLEDGARRSSAYWPFSQHSPEWIAVREGLALGARVAFFDLPWAAMAGRSELTDRYADGALRRADGVAALCARLEVDDLDAAWDVMVEIDPDLDADGYLERTDALWAALRGDDGPADELDGRREAHMAARLDEAVARGERVIAVVGGLHAPALTARSAARAPAELPASVRPEHVTLALTPYDDERLDALTGYAAGLPSPGFYDRAWTARESGGPPVAEAVLEHVTTALRHAGASVSTADLAAARTTADALARLRGHAETWRTDLLDGVLGAVVKDELVLGLRHPVLDALHAALRGDRRGRLAADASRPPLVLDVEQQLAAADLEPGARPRTVVLDLDEAEGLARSRLLRRVQLLGVPGFRLLDEASDDGAPEAWELRRALEREGRLIEAAAYGASLDEAVEAVLLERSRDLHDARSAAELLVDAARCRADAVAPRLARALQDALATDPDVGSVGRAVAAVLDLHRFERRLGTAGRADVGDLLRVAWERALWLLDPGTRAVPDGDAGTAAVAVCLEAFERSGPTADLDEAQLVGVLERLAAAGGAPPGPRGAALGALWVLGRATDVARSVDAVAAPDVLGDVLHGLFSITRDVVLGRPELQRLLDRVVQELDGDVFLAALPGLRRAFSTFTPREKDELARALTGSRDVVRLPAPDVAAVAAVAALEARLEAHLRAIGLDERLA